VPMPAAEFREMFELNRTQPPVRKQTAGMEQIRIDR
jgi:hypothetical protein